MTQEKPTPTHKLNAEQIAVIHQLEAAQEKSGLADDKFARRWLGFSGSKWSRTKTLEYFTMIDHPQKEIDRLRTALGRLNAEAALETRFTGRPMIETDSVLALRKSAGQCGGKPISDPVRCVIFLAPTGGGKSFTLSHLRNESPDVTFMVEARECWKRSYYHCIRDICIATGVEMHDTNSPTELEQRLIARFSQARYTLLVDEGEYFGSQTLNLIKLLLNKTPTTIIIACIPTAYEKWNRGNSHEAGQIRRRTHRVVRAEKVEEEVVLAMLEKSALAGATEAAAQRICRAGERFGSYEIARRISNAVIQAGITEVSARNKKRDVESVCVEIGEALGGIAL